MTCSVANQVQPYLANSSSASAAFSASDLVLSNAEVKVLLDQVRRVGTYLQHNAHAAHTT